MGCASSINNIPVIFGISGRHQGGNNEEGYFYLNLSRSSSIYTSGIPIVGGRLYYAADRDNEYQLVKSFGNCNFDGHHIGFTRAKIFDNGQTHYGMLVLYSSTESTGEFVIGFRCEHRYMSGEVTEIAENWGIVDSLSVFEFNVYSYNHVAQGEGYSTMRFYIGKPLSMESVILTNQTIDFYLKDPPSACYWGAYSEGMLQQVSQAHGVKQEWLSTMLKTSKAFVSG